MPRRRTFEWTDRYDRHRPVDYLQPGTTWPQGPLRTDAPYEAHLARQIAEKLYPYLLVTENKKPGPPEDPHGRAKTVEQTAEDTEMTRETIYNVRDGETWPDFITIARLEIYFKTRLWGNEHRLKSP